MAFIRFSLLILLLAAATPASAAVIYDNGGLLPLVNGANFSQQNINNAIADDFALGAADTIQSVNFHGVHWISGVVPADDNFQITIYGDLAGAPDVGNVIGTSVLTLFSRTDTGFDHNNVAGADIYRYAMNLAAPINVGLGAHWVSIVSTTTAVATSFAWQRTDAVGNAVLSTDGGLTFSGPWGENVFSLSNTPAVPEPSTALLVAVGLAGLAWRTHRG